MSARPPARYLCLTQAATRCAGGQRTNASRVALRDRFKWQRSAQRAHFLPKGLARFIGCGRRRDPGVAQAARIHPGEAAAHLAPLAPQSQGESDTLGPGRLVGGRDIEVGSAEEAVAGLVAHVFLLQEVMERTWSPASGLSITRKVNRPRVLLMPHGRKLGIDRVLSFSPEEEFACCRPNAPCSTCRA